MNQCLLFSLVREMRIELTQVTLYAPQTYASTSSATRAINANLPCYFNKIYIKDKILLNEPSENKKFFVKS